MERTLTAVERIRNSAAKAGVVVNEVTPKRGRGLVVFMPRKRSRPQKQS